MMELVKRNLPKAHKDGGTIRILKREFEKEYLVHVGTATDVEQ